MSSCPSVPLGGLYFAVVKWRTDFKCLANLSLPELVSARAQAVKMPASEKSLDRTDSDKGLDSSSEKNKIVSRRALGSKCCGQLG